MTQVIASIGTNHFPAIAVPQTPAGDYIPVTPPNLEAGTPTPTAYAAVVGTLTVNGATIGGSSSGPGLVDLTNWGNKELTNAITNANVGVTASVDKNGRIVLVTAPGVPITIAGSANLLTVLGLTAGVTAGP